jgi:2-succinyl-5-enolpyruvyl-6-hydroxy-3-cyclohexene-1-carboxylate synthase
MIKTMNNMALARNVMEQLLGAGVKEFCLCPGARNSPFVHLFDQNPQLKTFNFFDERSAAYFALGRIAATRVPVAVITTSGTAVAELLPAAVEATYSSLPLILVTADRPKRYRGSGAPQSIDQVGMFSYYIEASFDLDSENTHISLKGLSWKKPTHINVCFSEPLLDGPIPEIKIPERTTRTRFPVSIPLNMVDEFHDFLNINRPLVILSTIPERARESVINFLSRLQAPIYAEGISGLRSHPALKPYVLRSGDRLLHKLLDEKVCTGVLRIGGVPTVRLWRDLEDTKANIPVFSFGYNHYTGLSRTVPHFDDLDDLGRIEVVKPQALPADWKKKDEQMSEVLQGLFEKHPLAEPSIVKRLSTWMHQSYVYLGNSLPIRDWDLAGDYDINPLRVVGNRGANGIDGQVSTFLGWCRPDQEHWCLVGDLTALYDLSSLWITPQLPKMKARIIAINNGGGLIFKRMFHRELFLNRHDVNFKSWAEMFKWDYLLWEKVPDDPGPLSDRQIIEIKISPEATEAFWNDWEAAWNKV